MAITTAVQFRKNNLTDFVKAISIVYGKEHIVYLNCVD